MTDLQVLSRTFQTVSMPDKANGTKPHARPRGIAVYVLVDAGDVVYIGSGDLSCRLSDAGLKRSRGEWVFDHAMCLPMPVADARIFEATLIRLLRPRYNKTLYLSTPLNGNVLYWLGFCDQPAADAEFFGPLPRSAA